MVDVKVKVDVKVRVKIIVNIGFFFTIMHVLPICVSVSVCAAEGTLSMPPTRDDIELLGLAADGMGNNARQYFLKGIELTRKRDLEETAKVVGGMLTDHKEDVARQMSQLGSAVGEVASTMTSLRQEIAELRSRGANTGGASSGQPQLGSPLTAGIGPRVFPRLRVMCDTGMSLFAYCPVTYKKSGVNVDVVVYSVTATRLLLWQWDETLKDEDLNLFLQLQVVPTKDKLRLSGVEFDDVMEKTPYRKFGQKKKNTSHYIITIKAFWLKLMASIRKEFEEDPKHWVTTVPPTLFRMKVIQNMMVQRFSVEMDDENYMGPSSRHPYLRGRRLSVEERKRYPPWQFVWWAELFDVGIARYFGIDTTKTFHHVRNGERSDNEEGHALVASFKETMKRRQEKYKETEKTKKKKKPSKHKGKHRARAKAKDSSDDDDEEEGGDDGNDEDEVDVEDEEDAPRSSSKKKRKADDEEEEEEEEEEDTPREDTPRNKKRSKVAKRVHK